MKTQFLTLTLIVFCASAQAQTKDSISRNWRIVEASISLGTTNRLDQELSSDDFKSFNPTSLIIQQIPSTFNNASGFFGPGKLTTSAVALNLGINKKDCSSIIRLGVLYQGSSSVGHVFSHTESTGVFDTLTSSATGETFYVDSTRSETYSFDLRNENLGFDGSVIYPTHYKRLNFFGGVGISALYSVHSQTFISHIIRTDFGQDYSNLWLQQNDVMESEAIKNKNVINMSVYVPIGIDFTLGKKRPLLAKTSLHAEFRPAFYMQQMPDSKVISSVSSSALFGLKYSI